MRIPARVPAALLVGAALLATGPYPAPAQMPRAETAATDSRSLLRALEDAFAAVADRVTPAVVNVGVKPRRTSSSPGGEPSEQERRFREFFGQEFYERFFRRRPPREEARSAGSGVIVDARGYVLTNNHVIDNAGEIEVRLSDDRTFKATAVGRDPKTDLAVLRIEDPPAPLPVAELGDSDRLRIGQWAIAIGNPFGLDRTVTVGIISATGRTRVGLATYEAFIQTDASINPGNSGGPLLDLDGRVIGINTAIVASGQGIGFAIPINMVREIMGQLIASGRVTRGWLGVAIQDLTDDLAASFGVPPRSGVLVSDVMKDSPAEAAGLRAGDIIVEFAGAPIKEVTDLQKRVAALEPGQPTPLAVIRDRGRTALSVRVGEMPAGRETEVAGAPPEQGGLGLSVEGLTAELAQRHGLNATSGVLVTEVAAGSSGAEAGIRPGDVILEVNRRPVSSAAGFRDAVAAIRPGQPVPVYLQRSGGGRNEYVVLKAPDKR
jgi:Do/DeqQ family serine protease